MAFSSSYWVSSKILLLSLDILSITLHNKMKMWDPLIEDAMEKRLFKIVHQIRDCGEKFICWVIGASLGLVFQRLEQEEVTWAISGEYGGSGMWLIYNSLILATVILAVWIGALSQWKVIRLRPCFGPYVFTLASTSKLQDPRSTWR
jgi:hypothetical protein